MSVQPPPFMVVSFLPPHLLPSNASVPEDADACFRLTVSIAVFTASFISNLLLLPLFILVLYVGLERLKRSSLNHSDVFLLHSSVMFLHYFLGFSLYFFGGYVNHGLMELAGLNIWTVSGTGQALLHLLMCVERYFAVLRPVRYLDFKGALGARVRTASITCVWLMCAGWMVVVFLSSELAYMFLDYILTTVQVIIISFCSVSVLFVLKRPQPGGTGWNRGDQTKRNAFYTMVAVMWALALRFSWNLINGVMRNSGILKPTWLCAFYLSDIWFDLPSNLLLPLLFLQQRLKPRCCTQTTESHQH